MSRNAYSQRIAVVHDWLYCYGGAERVLEQILEVFPNADIYTVIDNLPPEERGFLGGRPVHTSFLQKFPWARTHHRHYLPLMPLAVEQFDLSSYDIVISSSYAVAKGVITGPRQLHVSYVHSPMRYAWDLQHEYLSQAKLTSGPKAWMARWLLHKMRLWDLRTANGVDTYLANSRFVAQRIRKIYRREAQIIYPPVTVDDFTLGEAHEDFYLTVSRLVPYKRIDLIVETFKSLPDRRLVVIGSGPEADRIAAKAGKNVTLMGFQPNSVVQDHMRRARAFIFAAEEDFGIVPLEAQASGTPVIAFGRGGALETIRDLDDPMPTGLFFHQHSTDNLRDAIRRFEANAGRYTPQNCRRHALSFSAARFRQEFRAAVDAAWDEFLSFGDDRKRLPPVAVLSA
jgi:glycosyltransferase involved in cell wall biosynthesis